MSRSRTTSIPRPKDPPKPSDEGRSRLGDFTRPIPVEKRIFRRPKFALFGGLFVLNTFGVQTTSIVAVIGAAGLAIGLALQGSLANFAAGVLMIIFKPFKVGEVVEAGGVLGAVREIGIFTTVIDTLDNKKTIVPNAKLTDDNIVNWTVKGTRRVDMVFGIGYGDSIEQAHKVLEDIVARHPLILEEPEPVVRVSELGDSSVNFIVRPWTKTENYWAVYWDLQREVKESILHACRSIQRPQWWCIFHGSQTDSPTDPSIPADCITYQSISARVANVRTT